MLDNSSPIVREARLEDAEGIAQVHVASWQSAYRGIMPDNVLDQLSVAKWTEDWRSRLVPSERSTLVLEVEGEIHGWTSIGPSRDEDSVPHRGELYGIYLNPLCWSKGWGAMLYLRVEAAMRAAGFTTSSLWVLAMNQRASRFYERVGYALDGHTKSLRRECLQNEGGELMEVRYQKSL